ncbi:MAG: hypothetical protein ACHQJD_07400, partial [Thermoanaerobaculia bacterium]
YDSCGAFVVALGNALGVPGAAATTPQAMSGESQLATIVSATPLGSKALAAQESLPKEAPKDKSTDPRRRARLILAAILLLSGGGGIVLFLRPTLSKVKEPEPTAAAAATAATDAAALTTSASATPSFDISSKVEEAPAATEPRPDSPFEEKKTASRGTAVNSSRAVPDSLPFEEKRLRQTTGSAPKANVSAHPPVPNRRVLPPLLSGAAHSGDTQLGPAWDALDNARQPGGRLARENFVDAMGTARAVLARRPTAEARFLDAFSRAGVAFADGRSAEAWQLLTRALEGAGPAANSRALRFVEDEVRALGPNPGPDANWVMGLAFADVRGDLADELARAEERAPRSPKVREARVLAKGR